MTRVVLDDQVLAKLHYLRERVEVCNRAGQTVGFFTPADEHQLYSQVRVAITEEQLDRFENETGGRSLADILADLDAKP